MRHGHGYAKLGMKSAHRMAVLRNMATSLVLNEQIETTLARAKELRRVVEKLITLGKRGDLHARRQIASFVYDPGATVKIMSDLSVRHKSRPGGYTRILRLGTRRGDGAEVAAIQFVDFALKAPAPKVKAKSEKPV
jgi:large subunit ribosomal protein L17